MVFSTGLVSISTRPSVRNTSSPSRWRWLWPSFAQAGSGGGREDQETIRGIVFPNDAALTGQPVAASLRSSRRVVPGGQRDVLRVRDRGCRLRSCGMRRCPPSVRGQWANAMRRRPLAAISDPSFWVMSCSLRRACARQQASVSGVPPTRRGSARASYPAWPSTCRMPLKPFRMSIAWLPLRPGAQVNITAGGSSPFPPFAIGLEPMAPRWLTISGQRPEAAGPGLARPGIEHRGAGLICYPAGACKACGREGMNRQVDRLRWTSIRSTTGAG